MQSWRKMAVAGLVSGVLVVPLGPARAAAPTVYEQLAALNPGTTAAQMRAEATRYAAEHGGSAASVAAQALQEARRASADRSASSGGGGKKQLLPAAAQGDIFWSDSTTDHVGIYSKATEITHAPGRGKSVSIEKIGHAKAPAHTELILVNKRDDSRIRIAPSARARAAGWARKKEGKAYNSNFAFNKKINASKYNCSQLVWAAWKATSGIDLDNGWSKGVYPGDIREDRRTYVYKKSI